MFPHILSSSPSYFHIPSSTYNRNPKQGDVVYPAGAVGVIYNRTTHSQRFFSHDPAGGPGGLPAPSVATAISAAPAAANAAVDTPVTGGSGPFLGHTGAIVCIARHPLGAIFATGEAGRRCVVTAHA